VIGARRTRTKTTWRIAPYRVMLARPRAALTSAIAYAIAHPPGSALARAEQPQRWA